jgi:hypothetical protein
VREGRVLRPLVERAREGDQEAFDSLARQVGDRCMAIAFRILRDADRAEVSHGVRRSAAAHDTISRVTPLAAANPLLHGRHPRLGA